MSWWTDPHTWFWWEGWGKIVFSGFAGSVVGLVSAVIVVFIGRWLEHRRDEMKYFRDKAGKVVQSARDFVEGDMSDDLALEVMRNVNFFAIEAKHMFPNFASYCTYRAGIMSLCCQEAGESDLNLNTESRAIFFNQVSDIIDAFTRFLVKKPNERAYGKVDWGKLYKQRLEIQDLKKILSESAQLSALEKFEPKR